MTRDRQTMFWIVGLLIAAGLIHLLSGILLPFVAGMAVAYFLDPVADKLEERGVSRGLATFLILLSFFVVVIGILLLLLPLLQNQFVELAGLLPTVIESLQGHVQALLEKLQAKLPPEAFEKLREAAAGSAGKIVSILTGFLADVWSGGIAFFNLVSLIVITPVVAFYLLRDWDLITAKIDSWLPRHAASTIREQILAIDATIAGFVRGQASVCLVLATIYGVGLTVVGLKSGLLVGLGAGFISFIPYLGAGTGMIVGVTIAIFQFSDWIWIAAVAGIFLFGQTLESYFLTPNLVGDRVGLHPVWIIFALLAGGSLFGFTGVLLAVPAAAVIGVLIRFGISQYLDSPLYTGVSGKDGSE